jgi:hypothetical protein
MSSTGTVSDDSNCYSMNVSAAGLQFSEILFGENSTAKSWGTYTYKRNFSNTDIVTYSASQPAARNPTLVLGTNPYNFSMARLVGFTANTTNYLFRDVVGNHPAIGLQCHTWNAVYADDTPSNGYNGYMHLRQGMLFVR